MAKSKAVGFLILAASAVLGGALLGVIIWLTCWGMAHRASPIIAWILMVFAMLAGALYGTRWGARVATRVAPRD